MRISLQLFPKKQDTCVPINYQYPLSAAIYKILQKASPQYASFLHDKGYPAPSGRLMKLFTFSRLWIPHVRIHRNVLRGGKGPWRLQLGSPMLDEFVQNFVLGLFESTVITIGSQGVHAEFRVEQVEALPTPEFQDITRCKSLSPITASTMIETEDRPQIYYYRPEDFGLSEALRQNILQKYEIVHGTKPEDEQLTFSLDKTDNPRSRLIRIKEGTTEETQIKAFETYFTLTGNPQLMQTAWECGLGEHNSQGFGMVEVVSREKLIVNS